MIKKVSLTLIAILLVVSTGFCKGAFIFKGLGGGGQGALVYQDNGFPKDGLTGGFGLRGIVEFEHGRLGLFQYAPSLTFWLTLNDNLEPAETGQSIQYDQREMQIAINIADVKYMFNTSKSFFKPFAGISVLPCILINKHHDKWQKINSDGSDAGLPHDNPQTKLSVGFNAFGGVDFPIKDRVIPFIEVRFTATKEWAFKTIGGMTLWF